MTAAINFNNLIKVYGNGQKAKRALNGMSFSVEEGEIFGFLGPNGAGKTTSIHILLNFLFPTNGSCEIFGIDSLKSESRQRIGFLPEIFSFDRFLTGNDFLKMFGKLSNSNQKQVETYIPELLSFLEMSDVRNVRIGNYSKGMTQKIGLAQAMIGDPDLLILDEPTSGMDPIAKAKIKQLFLDLKKKGKTIFLSSHILSDIEDIADRVAIIDKGELLAVSKISDLQFNSENSCRIIFSGGDEGLTEKLTSQQMKSLEDGRTEIICNDRESKDFVLQSLLEYHANVISVKPIGTSLQSHFLKLVKQEELSND